MHEGPATVWPSVFTYVAADRQSVSGSTETICPAACTRPFAESPGRPVSCRPKFPSKTNRTISLNPTTIRLASAPESDSPEFQEWFRRAGYGPPFSRKKWEYGAIIAAADSFGLLKPGNRALGFGVGREHLPAFFASCGMQVLATDQRIDAPNAKKDWFDKGKLSTGMEDLPWEGICSEEDWRRVSFRSADMNAIPKELHGQFDLTWSACSMDHLGSQRKGWRFFRESMKCLRPGGAAIHTTEFDLALKGKPVRKGSTVFYRKENVEKFLRSLERRGCIVPEANFTWNDDPVTREIDREPHSNPHGHYTLEACGLVVTSIVVIARKPG